MTDLVQLKNGKLYHLEQKGTTQGPIALFVHGLGGNLHFFDAIIALGKLEENHNIILIDWEGHGLTPMSNNEKLSVNSLVEDIRYLLDYLEISKSVPIVLFGHSLGGLIATTFAALDEYNVEKLILLGPVQALGAAGQEAMRARAQLVERKGMSSIVNTICQVGLSEQSKNQNPLCIAFVRQSIMLTNSLGYSNACKALASAHDPNYGSIKAATLIISGSDDKTAPPPSIAKLSKAISQTTKVHQVEDIGHWHAIENPAAVSQAICTFLFNA
ncbi:alpha/beta-hydrolase [Meira miltonrushii]|uniref:Alpha/beta-hydrolase n=1 Tax=Meira miltonrushii TaxID=1280837 RepID=A0A316V1I1_9BASI|nr:alpha/beta-hydrolase [Meira miltonrushii]PWN31409.1 alpha/beta-hydrolase [Meira miltonrushii]